VCSQCALVFINPQQSIEDIEEFHDEGFLENKGYNTVQDFADKVVNSELKMKTEVADMLENFLQPGARILDVGCGIGTLLSILKNRGFGVDGVELARVDVAAAKEYYGLDIYYGSLEKFAVEHPEKKFDLIIVHHTLEHMPQPKKELMTMKKLLAPDGQLYIGVPNVMNIRKRPEVFFEKGHALSFSPHSLRLLLQSCGFGVASFSEKAAFPGAMDVVSKLSEADTETVRAMKIGENPTAVKRYVALKKIQYDMMRNARDIGLFMLPKQVRIAMGRGVYKWLKRR